MNLKVLKPSRKAPQAGDVFVVQVPDGRFFFGRVWDNQATITAVAGLIEIVIYDVSQATKQPVPSLAGRPLLFQPVVTNRLPWSRGYFETVGHQLLAADEVPAHTYKTENNLYFDVRGAQLTEPRGLVLSRGLNSFYTIDVRVSMALGIPPDPDSLP